MSDDIITRLRGKEHGTDDKRCEACDGFCCHCELCDCCLEILEVCLQAADEIERLRALLYIAESDRDYYHERFDQNQKCLDFIYKKKAWWKR